MSVNIITGDNREVMALLDDQSVQMCVTSPPYFGLRDYGVEGQLGLEPTPSDFVAALVSVFREVRRVLRDDGTLWLNLGDSYAGSWGAQGHNGQMAGRSVVSARQIENMPQKVTRTGAIPAGSGLKSKDLIGIPWRVALALQEDGWYLRSDIIWHKPNPMPESVTDRPTKAHEYLFLLTKSERYYYDAEAVKEPAIWSQDKRAGNGRIRYGGKRNGDAGTGQESFVSIAETRNRRTVWTVATSPYRGAHFATFPPKLIEPCILAGSKAGDMVIDPFGGAGTTGVVAQQHARNAILIELNPEYAALAKARVEQAGSVTMT